MNSGLPNYLYHYTSIDSLALILKNQTLRLSPLEKMDDLQESKTSDIHNIGRFTFVSSWTEESRELIPMWKMYTNLDCGVRIRLPKNPFLRQSSDSSRYFQACKKVGMDPSPIVENGGLLDTLFDMGAYVEHRLLCPQWRDQNILFKVHYTDDIDLLEPVIIVDQEHDNTDMKLRMGTIGHYKNTFWSFQKEWRYIVAVYNLPLNSELKLTDDSFQEMIERIKQGTEPKAVPYVDIPLSPQSMTEMEITPSPHMTPGYRAILNDLVERYNPKARIRESELLGLI